MRHQKHSKSLFSWYQVLLLSLCSVFLANVSVAATLKLGHGLAKDSSYDIFAETFAKELKERTNGSVKVRNFCCLKMGSEQEMFKKLQLGSLDGAVIAQNNAGPFFPRLDVLSLPYIFKDYEHAIRVLDGPIGKSIWADMPSEAGVHLVVATSVAFRHIYNTKVSINNMGDFTPLKYRVPKNSVMVDTYKAFGSDPVPLAWSETLTAVQTGTVDGGDLTIDIIYAQKFHEVAKHIAMTGHFVLAPPFFVSDRFMQKLDESEKAALYEAAQVAADRTREFVRNNESQLIQQLTEKHKVQFSHPDRQPFMNAAKKVKSEFATTRDEKTAKVIQAIDEAIPVVSMAEE